MRKIVEYPSKILRKQAKTADLSRPEDFELLVEIKNVLAGSDRGVGLAAPQIGVSKRVFGIKMAGEVNLFVNPRIVKTYGKKDWIKMTTKDNEVKLGFRGDEDFLEGCLSVPNYWGQVKRYLKIKAKWDGGESVLAGMMAVVFQHELDHLDGVLFIDHVKKDKGRFYKMEGDSMVECQLESILSK